MDKKVLSIKEVLKTYSFFTSWSLHKAINQEGLPHFRIGKRLFICKDKIDEWIENQQTSSKGDD